MYCWYRLIDSVFEDFYDRFVRLREREFEINVVEFVDSRRDRDCT